MSVRGARQEGAMPQGLGGYRGARGHDLRGGRDRRPGRAAWRAVNGLLATGRMRLLACSWRAGRQAAALLVAVTATALGAPVPADAAAASSHAAPDRAPGEIALLGVFFAVLIAVAAVVIRRGPVRGSRPRRGLLDAVRAAGAAAAETDVAGLEAAEPRAAPAGPRIPVVLGIVIVGIVWGAADQPGHQGDLAAQFAGHAQHHAVRAGPAGSSGGHYLHGQFHRHRGGRASQLHGLGAVHRGARHHLDH
jgi:hypothetical protein